MPTHSPKLNANKTHKVLNRDGKQPPHHTHRVSDNRLFRAQIRAREWRSECLDGFSIYMLVHINRHGLYSAWFYTFIDVSSSTVNNRSACHWVIPLTFSVIRRVCGKNSTLALFQNQQPKYIAGNSKHLDKWRMKAPTSAVYQTLLDKIYYTNTPSVHSLRENCENIPRISYRMIVDEGDENESARNKSTFPRENWQH